MTIPSSKATHDPLIESSLDFDKLKLSARGIETKEPIESTSYQDPTQIIASRTTSFASAAQKPDEIIPCSNEGTLHFQNGHSGTSLGPVYRPVHHNERPPHQYRPAPPVHQHPQNYRPVQYPQPYRPTQVNNGPEPIIYRPNQAGNGPTAYRPSPPHHQTGYPSNRPMAYHHSNSYRPQSPQTSKNSTPLVYRPSQPPHHQPSPHQLPSHQPPRQPPLHQPPSHQSPRQPPLHQPHLHQPHLHQPSHQPLPQPNKGPIMLVHQPMQYTNNIQASYAHTRPPMLPESAGKHGSPFPPATKENIMVFRNKAMESNDPRMQLEFAKFLLEAVEQIQPDLNDPKRTKKLREALVMEAQKTVKKLAAHSGMGKQGYTDAQFFLANAYGTGTMGLLVDVEKAFSLYTQGSRQGHPGCTFRAAVCYEAGAGTKRDKGQAILLYRKAANLGEPVAMYKLGMILLKGLLGQTKNPKEGISWLERAAQLADENHPHALHELGIAYEKEGVPLVIPDPNYALELFTQAAQYGFAPSQFKLGQAYENGLMNCPVDPRRSIAWYSKAAEHGEVEAEFALSGWYLTGADGVLAQNDAEAYLWARKAADRGYSKAEYAVGYYTETGTGVKQDLEEAKRWYMRAAAQNYTKAMQRLTELKYESNGPQQRRKHTREDGKDSDCTIM